MEHCFLKDMKMSILDTLLRSQNIYDMISQVACTEFPDHNFSIIEERTNETSHVEADSDKPSFSSSSSSSINSSSTTSSCSLSSLLVFPPPSAPSATSSFVSLFSTPSGTLTSAILSTTTLLTFPLSMVIDQKVSEQESHDDDENLSVPICMISSPTPPLNKLPHFLQSSQAASSLPTGKTDIRSSSLSSTSTLSSSSSPSLTSLVPNNLNISFAPSKPLNISLTPPKDGFAQRKMMQGKKLSVAINPAMNRLMDGCHTVGVIGPSRDRHKRESILYKSDFIMKDMSPSIRSSLGSFNESGQEDAIITPYAQLLNSLRNIRNNYFIVANLSPMRSRRLSGYEVQKSFNSPQLTDETKQKLAMDTLEEIEFCLDKLESMQTHPSAGQMAAHKFRQILNREMSQNPDLKTGGAITGYLKTFLDESGNEDKRNSIVENPSISSGSNSEVENGDLGSHKKAEEGKMSLSSFMSSVSPELNEMVNSTGDTWGVDLFELASLSNNRPLTYVAMYLFQKNNLIRNLRINETTFFRYICLVEDSYHTENSYHNNIHATDVLQATYFMLTFSAFKDIFSELEMFAVMFSAAVHDVDHPGFTNQFLINTGSELAILYNDESVLENHHATFAFQLLNKEGCDVISSFSKKQKQSFRKMTISIILATDMSKHLQHVANLKTMVEVKRLSSSSSSSTSNITSLLPAKIIDEDNYEDKMQILQSVVHCSDLSNPLKPLEVYLKWTDRIMEEFFRQGDREKDLNLDVSPLCDRDNSDICKSQIGFIDYVVHPLWEIWAALTNPDCQIILDHLENNRVWLSTQDALANLRNKIHGNTTDDDDDDNE